MLEDTDWMPFGKYGPKNPRDHRTMADVPASYFHYLWCSGMKNERSPVANYIRANLEALKSEDSDLIWDKSGI